MMLYSYVIELCYITMLYKTFRKKQQNEVEFKNNTNRAFSEVRERYLQSDTLYELAKQ